MNWFDWIRDALRGASQPPPPAAEQLAPPSGCGIGWQPSIAAPVFVESRDYQAEPTVFQRARRFVGGAEISFGPPTPCRVFFPSLWPFGEHGIVAGCGSYPLVVFAHGHCSTDVREKQYLRWTELPAQLARSGCVVVLPMLMSTAGGNHPSTNPDEVVLIDRVIRWMRTQWEYASCLGSELGVVGHSYGGMLIGRYAFEGSYQVSAFATLSSGWAEWAPGVFPQDSPLPNLTMPGLLAFGDADEDAYVDLSDLVGPKHKVVFADAEHWDFLPPNRSPCQNSRPSGPCPTTWAVAADITTLFFGKYLRLEYWPNLLEATPDSLFSRPRHAPLFLPSLNQMLYGAGFLWHLPLLSSEENCSVRSDWRTPSSSGHLTKP